MACGSDDRRHSRSTLRLCRPASITAATELRRLLRAWAEALGVAVQVGGAIELACYEALANVVCHAYPDRPNGPMELAATYDDPPAGPPRMTVTVTDHGRWRPPVVEPDQLRGRGMPMIRLLAGTADIVGGETGTTVRMSWDLSPASPSR